MNPEKSNMTTVQVNFIKKIHTEFALLFHFIFASTSNKCVKTLSCDFHEQAMLTS